MDNKFVFSKNLCKYMALYKMSRKDVAEAINVPYTTICSWIHAQMYPRIEKIEVLAKLFGISKADLIEDLEDDIPQSALQLKIAQLTPSEADMVSGYIDALIALRK